MRRPVGSSNKARFWQWAYDSILELQPQSGPGILTCRTTRGIFQRMLKRANNFGNNREKFPDEPDYYTFGYGVNSWGPYVNGGAIVATSVDSSEPRDLSVLPQVAHPELQQYFTFNGSPIFYPGVLYPPGVPLPGTFRFTSPYRRATCRVSVTRGGFGEDHWTAPRPSILAPGESVDFTTPGDRGFSNGSWVAVKI